MLASKTLRLLPVPSKNGTGSAMQLLQMISPGINVDRDNNPNDFIKSAPMTSYRTASVRLFCSADGPPQQAGAKASTKASPPPSSSSSQSAATVKAQSLDDKSPATQLLSQLPDKKQVEKYFFRIVAFIWDTSHWAYRILKHNVDEHIIKNKSVQDNYKKFLEKMEKSKKD
ncbi:uncharacterized protein LOC119668282 [Teleopsis dalmanni]|uniref:uncharacterized protein LOC119668282 n=1 Tax=Teleopsis dalmanni TaxID=139649 RepID=UPI0018CFB124|nr:uncharacterized protein LOC119668282 [Teleopsis dalmanni]XP_037933667.1 uncharacterized protein LOC119668282 [Teleopsis dalmanni]